MIPGNVGMLRVARDKVRAYLLGSADVLRETAETCVEPILAAAKLIAESLRRGGRLLICGNGGSAAESQHLAGEFVSVLNKNFLRPGIPATALTVDTSILTAIANDFGFHEVYRRQVEALGRPGDVLIGISTSGESENVTLAFGYARSHGMKTVALTGGPGGQLRAISDVAICVPTKDVQRAQEVHLAIEHLLVQMVEDDLFGGPDRSERLVEG